MTIEQTFAIAHKEAVGLLESVNYATRALDYRAQELSRQVAAALRSGNTDDARELVQHQIEITGHKMNLQSVANVIGQAVEVLK